MNDQILMIFLVMIFISVFLLSQGLIIPAFGESRRARIRLKKRLKDIEEGQTSQLASLLREKYLRSLQPWERSLESLPQMVRLAKLIEQSGHTILAYRVVLIAILLGIVLAIGFQIFFSLWYVSIIAALVGLVIPFMKLTGDRNKRMAKFDEQLPEALDIMKRALKAGHPFSETLHLVADEMDGPIAKEFGLTFADVNYGNDVRRAMLGLLERVPSVMVMALVTCILVQRETGGNLAEILEKIAAVIRGRFRFQRKVKTLSAEGRMSAWVLVLVPFLLFIVISVTTPGYLPILAEHELGQKFIAASFVGMVLGIHWIKKIIQIEV